DGHQHQAQRRVGGVVQAQAAGHTLPQAQYGETMGIQVGQHDNGQDQVDDLVIALHDLREIAEHPTLHALQDIVAVSVELGDGAQHAAVHQADHWHHYGVLELDAPDDRDIDQAGGKAKGQGEQHSTGGPGSRSYRQGNQDAQLG